MKDEEVKKALLKGMEDFYPSVQKSSAQALKQLGYQAEAITQLKGLYENAAYPKRVEFAILLKNVFNALPPAWEEETKEELLMHAYGK